MSTARMHLAAISIMLVLTVVLSAGWIAWADQPPAADKQAPTSADAKPQNVIQDIVLGLAQARALEGTEPEKARKILLKTRGVIDAAKALPEDVRAELTQQLFDRFQMLSFYLFRLPDLAGVDLDQPAAKPGDKKPESPKLLDVGQYPELAISSKSIELLKALNSTVSVNFKDKPLKDAIAYLEDITKGALTTLIDEEELKDKVDLNEPVTFKGKKLTVRTILRKLLHGRKLDYYIEDSIVNITSIDKAGDQKITALYPVAYLVCPPIDVHRGATQRRNLAQEEVANVKALVVMLESTIEPKYWDLNGGPGKMDYYPQTRSLIVTASQEVHYLLEASGMIHNMYRPAVVAEPTMKKTAGLNAVPWSEDVIKVYDIAGLLDASNLDRSKADLQRALIMAVPDQHPPVIQAPMGMMGLGYGLNPMQPIYGVMGGVLGGLLGGVPQPTPPGGAGILGNGFDNSVQYNAQPPAQSPKPAEPPAAPVKQSEPPAVLAKPAEPAAKSGGVAIFVIGTNPITVNGKDAPLNQAMMMPPGQPAPKSPPPCENFVILAHQQLLIVRQPPEVQEVIDRLLTDMKTAAAKGHAQK